MCTLVLVACSHTAPTKQYTVVGQIIAVAPERPQVTIKHEDIKGFMPGMTMTFDVTDAALLEATQPGDLVQATLVVGETAAHIASIQKTGHAPLAEAPPASLPPTLAAGDLVADAALLDQAGMPRRLADFRGHRVALTFIYTRCPIPNFCPLMNRHFAAVQRAIASRADLADVRLLSVTLDPAYDRPPVLQAEARQFQADPAIWTFLTGTPDTVKPFAEQFGIHSEVDDEDATQLIHNLRTAVIDPNGRLVRITSGNDWTPADLLAQLTTASAPRD
jgi:protein SCO1/2